MFCYVHDPTRMFSDDASPYYRAFEDVKEVKPSFW